MKDFGEERILEILRRNDEALTYGEVLAECSNSDSYFASLATNVCFSRLDISKLDLFFDDPREKAESSANCYFVHVLPRIDNLKRRGSIQHMRTNDKKQYETHTNLVSDNYQKILKRFKRELERKKAITPVLVSIAGVVIKEISKKYPKEFQHAVLAGGSSSIITGKPFIYYGNSDEVKSVSDLDITVLVSSPISLRPLEPYLDEISRKRKIILNPFVKISRELKVKKQK
jgi:hypothetical protein